MYHAVGDEGIPAREVLGVIGKWVGVPVVSIGAEEAVGKYGYVGRVLGIDNPTSSQQTQEELGVKPREVGLNADLELGHYFTV